MVSTNSVTCLGSKEIFFDLGQVHVEIAKESLNIVANFRDKKKTQNPPPRCKENVMLWQKSNFD